MNEELEHLRHVGGRIIEERTKSFQMENHLLKEALAKNNIQVPQVPQHPDESEEKLTKSEEMKLQQYYAMKQ